MTEGAGPPGQVPKGRWARARRALGLTWNTLLPLGLAALIVLPNLSGELPGAVGGFMRKLSVQQIWNMYAPDPARNHTYLSLTAEFADGRQEPLDEALQAKDGWVGIWDWQKRRADIWRFYAVMRADKGNVNRAWYLRGVCVREALAREEAPIKIHAEWLRRRFTPPDKVLRGAPGLGPVERGTISTMDCRTWPARDMIADARARAAAR